MGGEQAHEQRPQSGHTKREERNGKDYDVSLQILEDDLQLTVGGGTHLRSVAWAHELVVSGRPWDDTSQVCAHSIEPIGLKGAISLNNQISGITLKPLGKGVVASLLACQVFLHKNFISKGILGGGSTSSTPRARRNKEEDVGNGKASNSHGGRADKDQVHEVSALLVDVVFTFGGGHAHGSDGGAALLNIHAGRCECSRGADEGGGKEREELHGCKLIEGSGVRSCAPWNTPQKAAVEGVLLRTKRSA